MLLIAASALTVAAQPLITIRPAPDRLPTGITIRTPSDPSFRSLVEKILPPAAVPVYQHILPYAILIRNETSTPIIAMVLTIQITDAAGNTSKPFLYRTGSTPPSKNSVDQLGPGHDFFFAADPRFMQLASILSLFKAVTQKTRLEELANRSLDTLNSARSITLALDSGLFENGTVGGPDEANSLERWTNSLHIQAAFDNAVLAFQGRSTEELRNKGPDAVFQELTANLKQATELTIHR